MDPEQPSGFHIFLSYRREDTAAHAGRLHDFLLRGADETPGFAESQVFMDIDTIEPGDDFREVIAEAVAKCDVLLAVIGKGWTTVEDAKGGRRLDNLRDYVRLEIEAALEREIPVVPVLVGDAGMPRESDLPNSIGMLAFKNAVELSDARWKYDVGRLLASLKRRERPIGDQATGRTQPPLAALAGGTDAEAVRDPNRTSAPSIISIRRPDWTYLTPEGREEIKRRFDAFVNEHREGDVLDARIGDITSDWADVYLACGVAGTLRGKPVPRTGEQRLLALRTEDDQVVREFDAVRVRIDRIEPADTLAGWEIELSVVETSTTPQDAGP
jgi:hypothetical protein